MGLEVAKACQALLAAPIEYQRLELPSVPSIGLASFPRDGDTAEAVLKHADTAMYQAKSAAAGHSVCRQLRTGCDMGLHMTVTGEGIERRSQLDWLRDRGCHEGQGFYLSRPLRAESLVTTYFRHPVLERPARLMAS